MKRKLLLALMVSQLLFILPALYAQGKQGDAPALAELRKEFKSLALTDAEKSSLEKIVQKDEGEVEKNQAELKVLQARLERLMLEKTPQMDAIKALLKDSLEWEYKIRLIRLERNIAFRGILGQDRWATLYKLSKVWGPAKRSGKTPEGLDERVLKFLDALQ